MTEMNFIEHTLTITATKLRYLSAGEGPVLVCVQDIGTLEVTEAQRLLALTHKVLVLEIPLLSMPASKNQAQHKEQMAGLLVAALAALGLSQVNLWGRSFSAQIALLIACLHKEMVRTLILSAPIALAPQQQSGGSGQSGLGDEVKRQALYLEELVRDRPEAAAVAQSVFGTALEPAYITMMAALECPTLILCGTRDQISPSNYGRLYKEIMPKSNLVMIYDAGHGLENERPQAVREVVADYVERHDSFLVTRQDGLINP